MIQFLATVFILYEVSKLLLPVTYIKTFKEMGNLTSKNMRTAPILKYSILFILEVLYMLFTAVLLFTSYWLVGLLLILLAIVFKKRLSPVVLYADSILSIIVLSLVYVL